MWLTFSTVAGGIYFHEFENAHTSQWLGLICGMMLNYLGLYYLVPTAGDQPMLVINMEKKQKTLKHKAKAKHKRKQVEQRDSDVSGAAEGELEPLQLRLEQEMSEAEVQIRVEEAIAPSLSDEEAPLLSRSPSLNNLNSARASLPLPLARRIWNTDW